MNKNVKKDIIGLIEGIVEFNSRYVTYNARVLRRILEKTLNYIERLEQATREIESLCKNEACSPCKELEENNHCDECHNKIILDIIKKAKEK